MRQIPCPIQPITSAHETWGSSSAILHRLATVATVNVCFSMNSRRGCTWPSIRTRNTKSRLRLGSTGSNLYVSWDQPLCLKIQPLCLKPNTLSKTKTTHEVEFMFLDEFTARFEVVPHQDSKSLIRCKMSLRAFQTLCLTDSSV